MKYEGTPIPPGWVALCDYKDHAGVQTIKNWLVCNGRETKLYFKFGHRGCVACAAREDVEEWLQQLIPPVLPLGWVVIRDEVSRNEARYQYAAAIRWLRSQGYEVKRYRRSRDSAVAVYCTPEKAYFLWSDTFMKVGGSDD